MSSGPCTLDKIILGNANAATQALLIEDGDVSLGSFNCPPGSTVLLDFGSGPTRQGLPIATTLSLTPASANLTALVFFH